jgi:hypothetical protein
VHFSSTFWRKTWSKQVRLKRFCTLASRARCPSRCRASPRRAATGPRHRGISATAGFQQPALTSAPDPPSPRAACPRAERTASRRPCFHSTTGVAAVPRLTLPPYHAPMLLLRLRVDLRKPPSTRLPIKVPELAGRVQCAGVQSRGGSPLTAALRAPPPG